MTASSRPSPASPTIGFAFVSETSGGRSPSSTVHDPHFEVPEQLRLLRQLLEDDLPRVVRLAQDDTWAGPRAVELLDELRLLQRLLVDILDFVCLC